MRKNKDKLTPQVLYNHISFLIILILILLLIILQWNMAYTGVNLWNPHEVKSQFEQLTDKTS